MKKRLFRNKCGLIGWLLLLVCSCGEEISEPEERSAQEISVKWDVTLDPTGYDSELVPMSDTRASDPCVVTELKSSVLFILQEVDNKQWALVEQRENLIKTGPLLSGEVLQMNRGLDCVLLPGNYRFLLMVNPIYINSDIPIGTVLTGKERIAVRRFVTYPDFFFASLDVTLNKTNQLDKENVTTLHFDLKRHSALLRFILEGEGLQGKMSSIIDWTLTGKENQPICVGMNMLGQDVMDIWTETKSTEILQPKGEDYMVDGCKWRFSYSGMDNNSPAVYATEEEQELKLTIKKIGNSTEGDTYFEGNHEQAIVLKRNCITTVVICREGETGISTRTRPDTTDWSEDYPPLNYVELNNQ